MRCSERAFRLANSWVIRMRTCQLNTLVTTKRKPFLTGQATDTIGAWNSGRYDIGEGSGSEPSLPKMLVGGQKIADRLATLVRSSDLKHTYKVTVGF